MEEEWRPIPGFGGHYEASSLGRIRVKDRIIAKSDRHTGAGMQQFYKGRLLKQSWSKRAYKAVQIGFDNKRVKLAVHRAVLMAFVGQPQPGQEACHNNGIGSDNRIENLRWDSHLANNRDRLVHGTYLRGRDHPMSKFTESQIQAILSGLPYMEAKEQFGISVSRFYRIKKQYGDQVAIPRDKSKGLATAATVPARDPIKKGNRMTNILAVDRVRELLNYDQETGVFTWKARVSNSIREGAVAGHLKDNGYMQMSIDGKRFYAHRLAWVFVTGEWPKNNIDHINGDRADNRIANLRDVDASTNQQNQRAATRKNKSSGLLGVIYLKEIEKFVARIGVAGKQIYLGYFADKNEAHAAYLKAKRKLHAGCTI